MWHNEGILHFVLCDKSETFPTRNVLGKPAGESTKERDPINAKKSDFYMIWGLGITYTSDNSTSADHSDFLIPKLQKLLKEFLFKVTPG